MLLPQLRRVRWAVRATLVLGVAASVVANVLHALDNPISQAIAAWPPLALLLTVELISRVPVHRRSLAFCRLLATAIIAGIAAWVSYWHMAGVAARYGETGASPYLLPLSVDGLIVVASICLVELGGQIATLDAEAQAASRAAREAAEMAAAVAVQAATQAPLAAPQRFAPAPHPVRASAQPPAARPVAAASPTSRSAASGSAHASRSAAGASGLASASRSTAATSRSVPASKSAAGAGVPGLIPVPGAPKPPRRSTADALAEVAAALTQADRAKQAVRDKTAFTPTVTRQPRATAPARRSPMTKPPATTKPSGTPAAKARRSPAETVAAAAQIKAERPDVTETQLAAELGISASRWRTIRREAGSQGDDLRLAA